MTVYATSFGTDTTGAAPANWTQRWTASGSTWVVTADAGTTQGKFLRETRTSTFYRLLSWNDVDADANRDNSEIFTRFRTNSVSSPYQVFLILRGSGSAGSETGYILHNISDTQFRVSRLQAGTLTTIATFNFTWANSVFLGMRFRVNGTTIQARVWNSQIDAEPATWNVNTTDANIAGTGWVGVGNFATTGNHDFDDVAVGTNGDTAVFPTSAAVNETQDAALVLGAGTTMRSTQVAALVVGGPAPLIRETQFAALVMGEPTPPIRATRYNALPLVEFFADTPVTQMTALVLAEHIPCTTQWAQTWTITRVDGTVFAFTSLDRPLTFRGAVHTPCASLSATATEQSTTIGSNGNMELLGIIADSGISEQELYNGLFDHASFEIWMVPWLNHGGETPFRLMAGTTGTMSHGVEGFKFEVLTGSANLRQRGLMEVFTASCRYGFGSTLDSRCPVDLAAITVTGSATTTAVPAASNSSTRRVLIDSSRIEAAGFFDLGILTFTGGANAGASSEIKRFENGVFILWSPLLYAIEVGDSYSATPGCNKSPDDHLRFNADMIDFGGFPDVPGSDSINQFPDAKG